MELSASSLSLQPEVVARFPHHWPSGIAPARDGRIFLSFPRLDPVPAPATLAELIDGKAVPFPDPLVNALDADDAGHRFCSIHGLALAPGNRLLALDTGSRSTEGCDPRKAMLWVIDLEHNTIVHGIGFPDDVCLPTSYLNDLVIDPSRGKAGYAFISDSGPHGPNGILAVDLNSGNASRHLSGDPSVRATTIPGFGIATQTGFARHSAGIDGITLSPDDGVLWWSPLGSYDLYSIEVETLLSRHIDPHRLGLAVRSSPRNFATDGLDCDREGRIYCTDGTHGTIQRYLPAEDRYEMLLHGDGYFLWPDAVRLGPDRTIYITDSQADRSPAWNDGTDARKPPYTLWRAAIDADPAQF
jgi:sugar lactone lactonase YvrE